MYFSPSAKEFQCHYFLTVDRIQSSSSIWINLNSLVYFLSNHLKSLINSCMYPLWILKHVRQSIRSLDLVLQGKIFCWSISLNYCLSMFQVIEHNKKIKNSLSSFKVVTGRFSPINILTEFHFKEFSWNLFLRKWSVLAKQEYLFV